MSKSAIVLAVLAPLLLAPAARGEDWPSFGLSVTRGRLASERSGASFVSAWQHTLPAGAQPVYRHLLASPAVADGYVAFGAYDGTLRVLRESDGQRVWDTVIPGPIHASPAAWRGWLFVPAIDSTLYALRLADGSVAWKSPMGGMGLASPVVVDGSVLVATGSPVPQLLRIDAETGALQWAAGSERLQQAAVASVAVADGRVLVGENAGRLHSFALADGHWQWSADTGGAVKFSSPLVLGSRVYLLPGGKQARVHALDLTTGAPVAGWPITLEAPAGSPGAGPLLGREHVVSSPAGGGGLLLLDWRIDDRHDSNGDGVADAYVSREQLVAIDADTGKQLWSTPNGRLETSVASRIPIYGLCPTPALFAAANAETLVVATSSLDAQLRVLGAADGQPRWTAALAAGTRSSPVFANGRLIVASDAGTVASFLSRTNLPPVAPVFGFSPSGGQQIDVQAARLAWGTAVDPEMQPVEYLVRLDDDGEILHDWDLATTTSAGEIAAGPLLPGRRYSYAVRARDAQGAWSDWSSPAHFRAGAVEISVGGERVASLAAAAARVAAGGTITLGAGEFQLTETLVLPAAVTLVGAGPHLTVLRAVDLSVAIKPGGGAQLRHLTVAAARIGVQVEAEGVHLRNVILRDNAEAGLVVTAQGGAVLVNATVTRNGAGVRAAGGTVVRNTLVTANQVGLTAAAPALMASKHNNVYGNQISNHDGVVADVTNLASAVTFAAGDADDLRLAPAQASTDRGDPSDDFAQEPAPNGARINIGAFGNTPFAELSESNAAPVEGGPAAGDAGVDVAGAAEAPDAAPEVPPTKNGCSCAVGGASGSHLGAGAGAGCFSWLLALLGWRRWRQRARSLSCRSDRA